MNHWVIAGIIFGLLLIGGVTFVTAISTNQSNPTNTATCTSCGGKCTAGNNCGLATCGATQGKACACGQK